MEVWRLTAGPFEAILGVRRRLFTGGPSMIARRASVILSASILLSLGAPAFAAPRPKKPAPNVPEAAAGVPVAAEYLRSLKWRMLGPASMGGRVSDVALVPGKPSAFFVAMGIGGVFRTRNDGTTFAPVFDTQPVSSIGSVAVAPSDAKIVYVGTGEGNGRNSSSWGNGIYRSSDGGDSFIHAGLDDSRDIPRIAIHPKDPDTVYAAVMGHLWDANPERGLYKTSDGGKTWNAALHLDSDTGCVDVLLNPVHPDTVYAAMYARRRSPWSFVSGGFGDKGGIYKSEDGGRTFHRVTDGLPRKTGRIGLALFEGDPSHVYAVIEADDAGTVSLENQLGKTGGVYRSTDGGEHWTHVSQLVPRPFYFSKIVVDPKDENRVYVLGFGLAISDDGGKTLRANGAELPHGDMHALVVDPADNEHLLMGTDGGVYESRDRAETWRYLDNIATGEYYELGLGMDSPYTICGGLQDNGTWCGPSQGRVWFGEQEDRRMNLSNQDWFFVADGDGFYVQVDPRDPDVIYAEAQEGHIGRVDRKTGRVKLLRPEAKEGSPAFRFNWDSPFVISHHDPDVLYLGGNRLFKLTKRGDAWEAISPDLSGRDPDKILTTGSGAENYGTITTISESTLARGTIWVGTDDGKVHLTRDDGKTWEDLTSKLPTPKGTWVSRIEASHFEPGVAIVCLDGHRTGDDRPYILETRDRGASWRSIAGDLPAGGPVKVAREDPTNPDLLFAGTEFGPFVTLDRGRHWLSLRGENFPAIVVHDLQIHPRDRDLVMGTHGRSIYVLDDITGLEQLSEETVARPVVLLAPRLATGFHLLPRGGMWGNNQFAVKNPPPGASLNYWVKERNPDGAKLEIRDASGHKVRELKGPAESGLNRVTWDLTIEKEARIDPPEARFPGQIPFVAPGTYAVTLTVGKESSTAKLTVSYAPGVGPETSP